MRQALALLAIAALTGCANIDYAATNYGDTPNVSFEHDDHPYRIFDKPAQNRLMITSSLGSAIGSGFVRGLTLGLIDNHPSEPVMNAAAAAYLKSTGRQCNLETGRVIAQPQWEFRYACAAPTVAAEQPAAMRPVE